MNTVMTVDEYFEYLKSQGEETGWHWKNVFCDRIKDTVGNGEISRGEDGSYHEMYTDNQITETAKWVDTNLS